MKKNKLYYLLLIFLTVTFSCNEDAEIRPVIYLNLEVKEPLNLSDGKVKLSAKITNFAPEEVSDYGFYIDGIQMAASGISDEGEFELVIDSMDKLTSFSYYPYFEYSSTKIHHRLAAKSFTTDFPIIDSYSDTIVTDYSTITISGSGFNANVFFYLVTKSSPSSEDLTLKLKIKNITDNEMTVSLPGIGSQDRSLPPFFEGAIQPTALYVGNEDMTMMKKIGDLDYRYRFHLGTKSGPVDGTFKVVVWSGRDVPPVEEIEVYFEGTKRILLSKEESFDFSSSGVIEAYILEYSIPFGTESGSVNKVTVFSPFGEEFISIQGDELFTVD